MTQSKYSELFKISQIFVGSAGIWSDHPLGSILGQEERLTAWVILGSFSLAQGGKEGIFFESLL